MPNYRPIFPSMFTAGNMFCGFLSIISAAEGEPTHAAWFIILAGFLDALDGRVARLSGGISSFGKELDSLADVISFGVAPAFLIYTFKLNVLGKWGWIIGMVYITASAFRLARFNLLAHSDEKKNFLGLPVPGAGLTLAAYVIFCYNLWDRIEYGEYLITMTILFSALMVSQVEYDAVPDNFNTRQNRLKLLYIIVLSLAAIIRPRLLMFPILLLYIGYGLSKEASRIIRLATATVSRNGRTNHEERHRKDNDDE
jgi:CDP-diacylglycerol--serine O-phosphatidyltransferase